MISAHINLFRLVFTFALNLIPDEEVEQQCCCEKESPEEEPSTQRIGLISELTDE